MRPDLRLLTESLRDGKVTERKKAVEDLSRWFRVPKNVAKIGSNNIEWIEIFEALASTAKAEHDATGKKGTSAATMQTKLENISSTFRVAVESSIPHLNNASIDYLVPRLVLIMTFPNALVDATGSNYARTLLSIVAHPPHVRSFTDKIWHSASRLAWAVLLNDRLSDKSSWTEDDPKLKPRQAGSESPTKGATASPVQLIFATIIRNLCASPFAPIIERERKPNLVEVPDEHNWACYLLVKFCRYFEMYQGSVTSHVDMIPALCHVLEQVELNRVTDMMWFSRRIWPLLVALMKGRVRTDYVQLLVIFKFILPYYVRVENDDARAEVVTDLVDSNSFKGLTDLVLVIDEHAPLKAGLETLSMDSLRLEFTPTDEDVFTGFRAKTFRHGRAFTSSQAHAWTMLELQADCIFYLYRQEETTPQSQFNYDGRPTKRRRSENALEILVNGLKNYSSPMQGLFRLQVLLFLTEKRWDYLDITHQQLIMNALFRLSAVDESADAFTLMCFVPVATASNKAQVPPVTAGPVWSNMWTHAYRKLSSPSSQVSRAACHVLHALLKWNRVDGNIVSQHVAQFIRDFREDNEDASHEDSVGFQGFQGGSVNKQTIAIHAVTESSCALLGQFIAFADADAVLCRLHLEDSVRKWLRKCLNRIISTDKFARGSITTGKGNKDSERLRRAAQRLDAHINAQDLLFLLQSVCGLAVRPAFKCDTRLPDDELVRAVVAYQADRILRQFILHTTVPSFVQVDSVVASKSGSGNTATSQGDTYDGEFSSFSALLVAECAPSARESKTLTMLEDLTRRIGKEGDSDVETAPENQEGKPVPISSSGMLEKAVVAIKVLAGVLGLQASLEANSTRPSSELYRLAFSAFRSTTPWRQQDHQKYDWAAIQWAEIMCELRPLTWTADPLVDPCQRQLEQLLLRPGNGSGIRCELARRLLLDPVDSRRKVDNDRGRHLINTIWSQKSASDCLSVVNESLRALLQLFSDGKEFDTNRTHGNPFDTLQNHYGSSGVDKVSVSSGTAETYFASVSVAYITTSSTMSKDSGNPQSDPELEQVILQSEGRAFLTLGQAYCNCIQAGTLHAGPAITRDILIELGQKLKTWDLWRSESMHTLVFQILDSLSLIWLQDAGELRTMVQKFFPRWAIKKALSGGSWKSRTAFSFFLGRHLLLESFQKWWKGLDTDDFMDIDDTTSQDEDTPLDMLGDLLSDGDIRVRYISGVLYPAIFAQPGALGQDIMVIYTNNMTQKLPSDSQWFEGMLSRFVALSNTIVTSSPLRRGVYWHLLEITLQEPHYSQYLVSLLAGVSARLGLTGPQALFRAYSAQIAIQVSKEADFLKIPPKVLGFRTHKECADSTLPIVLPITIISTYDQAKESGIARPSVLHDDFFYRYCKAVRREPVEALRACFTQIVAGFIIFDHEGGAASKSKSSSFRDWLLQCARECDSDRDPMDYMQERADAIAAAIFCYGGDIDYHSEGDIVDSLRGSNPAHSENWVKTFRKLNQFRRFDDFPMHPVHFPAATTTVIIKSLGWFTDTFVREFDNQAGMSSIYHTIHHLFAAVHSTPLVNEQLRYIHSLCVFLSITEGVLDQPPMVHTILTHSIALLSQEDLAHSAQSIITWALECARHAGHSCQDIGIGALISRIAELSVQFSHSKDQRTSNMGFQLLNWVETELQKLCEGEAFQEELQVVITLWPRTLRIQGHEFINEDTAERTTRVLSRGETGPTGRFRIVRQLNAIPMYATGTFATEHFWTLKESIPVDALLMREDLSAFMELLYKGSGKFHSIRNDVPEEDGLASRHRKNPEESVKYVIVSWLLSQMTIATADALNTIHNALRRLCHPSCGVLLSSNDTVLSLFRAGAQEPLQVVECDASFLKKPASWEAASNYDRWLCDTSIFLSRLLSKVDIFYAQLHSLLAEDSTFAINLLPILVHQLLGGDCEGRFEPPIRPVLSNYFLTLMRASTTDANVLQAIIDLVLHLRHFERPGDDPVGYDKWLDIGFMDVCKTSLKCGAYTTSLLFLELAQEYQDANDEGSHNDWELDMENVLYEIYLHVDEPDGFYAIKGKDIRKHLMQKFHHENKWDKAFQSHVSQFEVAQSGIQSLNDGRDNLSGVVESLHSYGFSHLAMSLARGTPEGTSADFIYSLAWRTDAWDLPQVVNTDSRNASLYGVMRAVHRGKDMESTKLLCETAARREMQTLRNTNPENVVEIRNAIQSLLCLREIQHWVQDWRQLQSQPIPSSPKRLKKYFTLSPELDFSAAECIVATRISLVRCLIQSISGNQIGNMESSSISSLTELETRCLVDLAANARVSNMPQIAFNAVSRAQQINPLHSFHISTEFAEALWTQQEHAMAIQFLTQLIRQKFPLQGHSSKVTANLRLEEIQEWAKLYARLGSWTTAARFASPEEIRTQWFDPGVKLLDPLNQIQRRAAKMVYYQYASFANKQLRQMEGSEEYKRQKEWSADVKAEIKELDQGITAARTQSEKDELRRRREKSLRFLETDQKNLEEHEAGVKSFLQQAISMYAHYMEASNNLDQEIAVRFCGVWFAHFDSLIAAESIKHALPKISPHKLLFLSHQLTARLGSSNEAEKRSQHFLKQLVEAMCSFHPFHSLFQVLTMRGLTSAKDARVDKNSGDISSKRREEARRIVETVRLKIKDGSLARPDRFMELMEESFAAYVEWAQYPIKELNPKHGGFYSIPKSIALYKWTWDGRSKVNKPQPLCIPVVTGEIPIEMDGKYQNIPTIHWYERRYTVAGGVHVPKINLCVDTLGRQHRQLFKGEGGDDLRQDAVMEQVFELVNIMLAQDRESRRRELSLRTYKVIPLPQQTGLLQFIDNTETMSAWLPKAHAKYRPADMPLKDTQTLLKQQARNSNLEERVKVFLRICREFRPVLRHFFTESNKQPVVWYAKRLTYSRSVATCSLVGHILGLGDRHISNLLMDARTGEMIHIDLGIAFDQGRYLPIPELVPFRLTADVVDGMGISGTEGVFRKCSEQTLRVLREGSDIIKTVLEVFKYDPLYIWTATPDKLRRVQDGDVESAAQPVKPSSGSEQVLQGAERAIDSVSRKLDAALSVEYTVNELINAARDPANLTRIFHGWSPQC